MATPEAWHLGGDRRGWVSALYVTWNGQGQRSSQDLSPWNRHVGLRKGEGWLPGGMRGLPVATAGLGLRPEALDASAPGAQG